MKAKNNKFQKGDVVFYKLPEDLEYPWVIGDIVPAKIKTVFPVNGSYRYLVKVLDGDIAKQLGGKLHYVDEVGLVDPDEEHIDD